jgi:SulP family sulfate permease
MGAIVIAFPELVGKVVMPGLGALLVIAGLNSIDRSDVISVWRRGWQSRLTAGATFFTTLFLPIQFAVATGVFLAALLYLNRSSTHITLVELVKRPDGRIVERAAPKRLPDDAVTVLDVYGDLFFAGARTFDQRLPDAREVRNPAVILRLRGRSRLGATAVEVISDYAEQIHVTGGRFYVTGLGGDAVKHLERTTTFGPVGTARAYEGTAILGESTEDAYADAQAWLCSVKEKKGTGSDDAL